jgi:hypothetical protein
MKLSRNIKEGGLIGLTSLAVAYVRHGLETSWKSFSSAEQFFLGWFIHWVALMVLVLATVATITSTRKFFLGSSTEEPPPSELLYYVVVTVLVATVAIFVLAHWVPVGDDLDS